MKLNKEIKLLCITIPRQDLSYEQQVKLACEGGADMIQFRDKKLSDLQQYEISCRLQDICSKYGTYFTVNNRVDIANLSCSDGVHLGQQDLPVSYARKILGNNKVVGLSASTYEQAIEADKQNIDYIGYGAIFSTETKPESVASGLEVLNKVKNNTTKPIIAIGGIDASNVCDVIKAGADGVAVVRAVCGAQDVRTAAEKIKNLILKSI